MDDANKTETETKGIDLLALLAEVDAERAAGFFPVEYVRATARSCKVRLDDAKRRARHNPKLRCNRCDGTGHLQEFYYVAGGVCFDCNGWGVRDGHL
jgi:hypothetical protein